jgi:hypothetical protein
MTRISKLKAEIIAKNYLKNGMNMSETVRQLKGDSNITEGTIQQKSTQWLKNPEVNQALIELMASADIEKEDVAKLIGDMIKELAQSNETATFKGKVIKSDIPNYKIKMSLLQTLLKTLLENKKSTIHQHLHIENKTDAELKDIIQAQYNEIKEYLENTKTPKS